MDKVKKAIWHLKKMLAYCDGEDRDAIQTAITAMESLQWIPVSERLPAKEEKTYMVCLEGGGQCQCRWTNDMYGLGASEWSKWGWHIMDKPQYSVVTAWRPMTADYQPESEESNDR